MVNISYLFLEKLVYSMIKKEKKRPATSHERFSRLLKRHSSSSSSRIKKIAYTENNIYSDLK